MHKTQRYLWMVESQESSLPHGFCDKILTVITLQVFCYARHMVCVSVMDHSGVVLVGFWTSNTITCKGVNSVEPTFHIQIYCWIFFPLPLIPLLFLVLPIIATSLYCSYFSDFKG